MAAADERWAEVLVVGVNIARGDGGVSEAPDCRLDVTATPSDPHESPSARMQVRGLVQHMVQQRAPGQALQHFGDAALHARAFAGRHDHDVQWNAHKKEGERRESGCGPGWPCCAGLS